MTAGGHQGQQQQGQQCLSSAFPPPLSGIIDNTLQEGHLTVAATGKYVNCYNILYTDTFTDGNWLEMNCCTSFLTLCWNHNYTCT